MILTESDNLDTLSFFFQNLSPGPGPCLAHNFDGILGLNLNIQSNNIFISFKNALKLLCILLVARHSYSYITENKYWKVISTMPNVFSNGKKFRLMGEEMVK